MRTAILFAALSLLVAGPALGLGSEPVYPSPGLQAPARTAPAPRADRWRGAPYMRSEQDRILREALDKNITRDTDLAVIPSFQYEDDVLRREALNRLMPVVSDAPAVPGLVPGL